MRIEGPFCLKIDPRPADMLLQPYYPYSPEEFIRDHRWIVNHSSIEDLAPTAQERQGYLLRPEKQMTIAEALSILKQHSSCRLLPARLRDLLSFQTHHPYRVRSLDRVVALGTQLPEPPNFLGAPWRREQQDDALVVPAVEYSGDFGFLGDVMKLLWLSTDKPLGDDHYPWYDPCLDGRGYDGMGPDIRTGAFPSFLAVEA